MKLRILRNTIRLRLKRGEVAQVGSGQSIVEQTQFPDSVLTYRLDVADDGQPTASFDQEGLTVRLPKSAVEQWATSDQVSIVADQALEDSGTLSVLVEKDFKCLSPGHHRDDEDDADTFPHPDADSGTGC